MITYALIALTAFALGHEIRNWKYDPRVRDMLTEEEIITQIMNLPDNYQKIIQFKYMYGMSDIQIAERIGLTRGDVVVLHSHALKRLIRKHLNDAKAL